jgi:hypothetical protein
MCLGVYDLWLSLNVQVCDVESLKKSFKIPKGNQNPQIERDNTMAKRKRTNNDLQNTMQ